MSDSLRLRAATEADVAGLMRLLEVCRLPTGDVPPLVDSFTVAEIGGNLVGVCALEHLGDVGLLRSVAVEPADRGLGIARALCEDTIERARTVGLRELYLLTTDASEYFRRYGFSVVDRDSAPEAIKAGRQFREMCPSSATLMSLPLQQ